MNLDIIVPQVLIAVQISQKKITTQLNAKIELNIPTVP